MNNTAKKTLNIALKVATWLLITFTVLMMIFTIVTVTTVDRNDRGIFGYKFYIVLTDSMSPSENNKDMDVHFDAGDIVIIEEVDDRTNLQPGDIISFMSTNSDSYGQTITHMIREVQKTEQGKVIGYVTFGTNTGVNDEALVAPEEVLGVYSGKLPGVGNFFEFVQSTPGYIVCILVPFLLLILYNGVNVVILFRRYKREQTEALKAEKDQINAERAENQRMMQELLALKAQLEKKGEEEKSPPAEPASEQASIDEATSEETVSETSETDSEASTTEATETESQEAATEATDENK